MANEITFADSARVLDETLHNAVLLRYADRTLLMNHEAIIKTADPGPAGSITVKVPQVGWMGFDLLQPVAEGAIVGNTALTEDESTVAVGRQSKRYEYSELASLADVYGQLDPNSFAADAAMTAGVTLTNLIAALMGGFSAGVGATGVNLSILNWYDALTTLELANVPGQKLAIIHGRQYADLRNALLAETGTLSTMDATREQMVAMGSAYKGRVAGVDILSTTHVPTTNAGADRSGGMFGRGSILWTDATIKPNPAVVMQISAGKVVVKFSHDDRSSMTGATTVYYLGVAEGQDAGGVRIDTDA